MSRLGPEGLDLLRGLLQLDPARRISAREALAHPFFAPLSREVPGHAQAVERTPSGRHRHIPPAGITPSTRPQQHYTPVYNSDDANQLRWRTPSLLPCPGRCLATLRLWSGRLLAGTGTSPLLAPSQAQGPNSILRLQSTAVTMLIHCAGAPLLCSPVREGAWPRSGCGADAFWQAQARPPCWHHPKHTAPTALHTGLQQ